MPSASVTAKIASISFIVTTSSMKADLGRAGGDLPPRLLLDGNALGAARALGARLRLAGHEDLGGAGRGRGAADPPEQRGHLRVEFGRRQESRGIEGDDERAVRELALLGAGPARARQDAAEDLDGEREPVALVRAGRQQRARGVAVELPGIRRRLAARVQHDPRRHLLAAVELHAQLALGPTAGGVVVRRGDGAAGTGNGNGVGVRAEPLAAAAPRRHIEAALGVGPEHPDQARGRHRLGVVGEPAHVARAAQRHRRQSVHTAALDGQRGPAPRDDLTEAVVAVEHRDRRCVDGELDLGGRVQVPALQGRAVLRHADDAVGVVAAQVGAHEQCRDPLRVVARHVARGEDVGREDQATYFVRINVGKRSVALDLTKPEARPVVLDLARRSDVVVENFVPGVVARLGCDHATLSAVKPDLVYCSISGFGQTGPWRALQAFAHIISAVSGLMHLERNADAEPRVSYLQAADVLAGTHAFGAICAALLRRGRTGRGAHLDVSMLECLVAAEDITYGAMLNGGAEYPGPRAGMLIHQLDGHCFTVQSVGAPHLWARLLAALKRL